MFLILNIGINILIQLFDDTKIENMNNIDYFKNKGFFFQLFPITKKSILPKISRKIEVFFSTLKRLNKHKRKT